MSTILASTSWSSSSTLAIDFQRANSLSAEPLSCCEFIVAIVNGIASFLDCGEDLWCDGHEWRLLQLGVLRRFGSSPILSMTEASSMARLVAYSATSRREHRGAVNLRDSRTLHLTVGA